MVIISKYYLILNLSPALLEAVKRVHFIKKDTCDNSKVLTKRGSSYSKWLVLYLSTSKGKQNLGTVCSTSCKCKLKNILEYF